MKYELTNIPVLSAYEANPDCVFCHLEDRLEEQYVDFFLGNSVMVPEMRVEVNRAGFCGRHLRMLLAGENKLGLSLMLQTHMTELQKRIGSFSTGNNGGRKGFAFTKATKESRNAVQELADHLETSASSCLLCNRLEHTLDNYRYTVVKLYETREDFREMLSNSAGICLRHTPKLLRMAADHLSERVLSEFTTEIMSLCSRRVERIVTGLEGFAEKFDYRNNSPMQEEERSSLVRAVRFLGSDDV